MVLEGAAEHVTDDGELGPVAEAFAAKYGTEVWHFVVRDGAFGHPDAGGRALVFRVRPVRATEAHRTDGLAELVCSNSFRGDKLDNAVGLLKEEMRRLGSLVMRAADAHRVPAGAALAVDRDGFSDAVTAKIAVAMSFALPSIALVAAAAGMFGDGEGLTFGSAQWIQLVGLMWLATTPITAIGALIGLTFGGEAAQGATTLAFVVLWLGGGIFTSPDNLPDTLAAISRALPSYGVVQVGESVAAGRSLSASALVVLAAWTVGAGALAALAWRRVLAR